MNHEDVSHITTEEKEIKNLASDTEYETRHQSGKNPKTIAFSFAQTPILHPSQYIRNDLSERAGTMTKEHRANIAQQVNELRFEEIPNAKDISEQTKMEWANRYLYESSDNFAILNSSLSAIINSMMGSKKDPGEKEKTFLQNNLSEKILNAHSPYEVEKIMKSARLQADPNTLHQLAETVCVIKEKHKKLFKRIDEQAIRQNVLFDVITIANKNNFKKTNEEPNFFNNFLTEYKVSGGPTAETPTLTELKTQIRTDSLNEYSIKALNALAEDKNIAAEELKQKILYEEDRSLIETITSKHNSALAFSHMVANATSIDTHNIHPIGSVIATMANSQGVGEKATSDISGKMTEEAYYDLHVKEYFKEVKKTLNNDFKNMEISQYLRKHEVNKIIENSEKEIRKTVKKMVLAAYEEKMRLGGKTIKEVGVLVNDDSPELFKQALASILEGKNTLVNRIFQDNIYNQVMEKMDIKKEIQYFGEEARKNTIKGFDDEEGFRALATLEKNLSNNKTIDIDKNIKVNNYGLVQASKKNINDAFGLAVLNDSFQKFASNKKSSSDVADTIQHKLDKNFFGKKQAAMLADIFRNNGSLIKVSLDDQLKEFQNNNKDRIDSNMSNATASYKIHLMANNIYKYESNNLLEKILNKAGFQSKMMMDFSNCIENSKTPTISTHTTGSMAQQCVDNFKKKAEENSMELNKMMGEPIAAASGLTAFLILIDIAQKTRSRNIANIIHREEAQKQRMIAAIMKGEDNIAQHYRFTAVKAEDDGFVLEDDIKEKDLNNHAAFSFYGAHSIDIDLDNGYNLNEKAHSIRYSSSIIEAKERLEQTYMSTINSDLKIKKAFLSFIERRNNDVIAKRQELVGGIEKKLFHATSEITQITKELRNIKNNIGKTSSKEQIQENISILEKNLVQKQKLVDGLHTERAKILQQLKDESITASIVTQKELIKQVLDIKEHKGVDAGLELLNDYGLVGEGFYTDLKAKSLNQKEQMFNSILQKTPSTDELVINLVSGEDPYNPLDNYSEEEAFLLKRENIARNLINLTDINEEFKASSEIKETDISFKEQEILINTLNRLATEYSLKSGEDAELGTSQREIFLNLYKSNIGKKAIQKNSRIDQYVIKTSDGTYKTISLDEKTFPEKSEIARELKSNLAKIENFTSRQGDNRSLSSSEISNLVEKVEDILGKGTLKSTKQNRVYLSNSVKEVVERRERNLRL